MVQKILKEIINFLLIEFVYNKTQTREELTADKFNEVPSKYQLVIRKVAHQICIS